MAKNIFNSVMRGSLTALLVLAVGCNQNDDTVNRDEVTLKAIYQEYELVYSIEKQRAEVKAYFRTSRYGSYVKLNRSDRIGFGLSSVSTQSTTSMSRTRFQPYWGSRNVPAYELKSSLNIISGSEVFWNWYDSETDSTFITKKVFSYPASVESSIGDGQVLDTMQSGGVEIRFSEPIKNGVSILVSFQNLQSYWKTNISKSLDGDGVKTSFFITSDWLREASKSLETAQRNTERRRYGNLEVDVDTRLDVPVLTSGEQPYQMSIQLRESDDIENGNKKGARVYSQIKYPAMNMIINF